MNGISHPLGRKPNKYYFSSSGINWKRWMTRPQRIFFMAPKNHNREKDCHCVIVYHFVSSYFLGNCEILLFYSFFPLTHSDVMCGILCVGYLAHHFLVISYKLTDVSSLCSVTAFLFVKRRQRTFLIPFHHTSSQLVSLKMEMLPII